MKMEYGVAALSEQITEGEHPVKIHFNSLLVSEEF